MKKRGRQAAFKSGQCLLRIRFAGKGHTAQLLEGFAFRITVPEELLVDRALRLGLAVVRGNKHPALFATAIS